MADPDKIAAAMGFFANYSSVGVGVGAFLLAALGYSAFFQLIGSVFFGLCYYTFIIFSKTALSSESGSTGGNWRNKLLHVEYEGKEVCSRFEFFSRLGSLQNDDGLFSVPQKSPFRSKIIQATIFVTDLAAKKWNPISATKQILTHHFVEMLVASGHRFTLEKGQDCILLQSCNSDGDEAAPIVRVQRDGKERDKIATRRKVKTDGTPKSITILDILRWIDSTEGAKGENKLMEPYHVADSNCQHFAAQFWHQLSESPYPNPSQFEPGGVVKGSVVGTRMVKFPEGALADNRLSYIHVAAEINGEILLIVVPCGSFFDGQETPKVHLYNWISREWRQIPASGDVPSSFAYISCLFNPRVPGNLIHAFVVDQGLKGLKDAVSEIYSLMPSEGIFQRLPTIGLRPQTREYLEGWSHENNLYCFGGKLISNHESSTHLIAPDKVGDYHQQCDNLLAEFNFQSNQWQAVDTKGPRPTPRSNYAAAKSNNLVFIHSGQTGGCVPLNDFYSLDMSTKSWTKIENSGPSLLCHTLAPVTENQISLIGGLDNYCYYNKWWLFNLDDSSWEKGLLAYPWSQGLANHRTVVVRTEDGISLVSVGGELARSSQSDQVYNNNFMMIVDIE